MRKQRNDRFDAQHILKLLLEDTFPRIWVPTPENRDLRQLVWHRHRLVGMRTRVMNQLQAVAMNEGIRRKKGLWSEKGRQQLESLSLMPWTTRRRQELLQLLDRFDPNIDELSQAIEQEAERMPEVKLLMTHPGVGADYGAGFRVGHRYSRTVSLRQASGQLSGTDSLRGVQFGALATRSHHKTRQ